MKSLKKGGISFTDSVTKNLAIRLARGKYRVSWLTSPILACYTYTPVRTITFYMAKLFNGRINKLNQAKKKFKVDDKKLLTYMDSDLTAHELELILGANDTIYLTQENIELIEKAMQKVLTENT